MHFFNGNMRGISLLHFYLKKNKKGDCRTIYMEASHESISSAKLGLAPYLHNNKSYINSIFHLAKKIGTLFKDALVLLHKLLKVLLLKVFKIVQHRHVRLTATKNTNQSTINKTVHQTFPSCKTSCTEMIYTSLWSFECKNRLNQS
jgi:hypothetical protein